MSQIRNIAIIAHVDHGKTTLVDGLLKQSQTFDDHSDLNQAELIMDSGDQEKERGITITAKITAIDYKGSRINIIDTPGHADFSGEVERTLNMAEGCILVVDAQEGPMPQTKYVLSRALSLNLKPIVVINKIDKDGRRIDQVIDEIDNLFLELATDESQLHYPIIYAIGRSGKSWTSMPDDANTDADLTPIYEAIFEHIPAPKPSEVTDFVMQVSALAWDNFKGKYAIGKVISGSIKVNTPAYRIAHEVKQSFKIDGIYKSIGVSKYPVDIADAGDIVQVTGCADAKIGDTISTNPDTEHLGDIQIEKPTLKIYLGPNTSTFKGQEGQFTTTRQIGDRLNRELETNVSLQVEPKDLGYEVSGRGELHLSVLIESMRREGYEFEVGRPEVVFVTEDNQVKEPLEELTIEVPAEYVGAVQTELGQRRANLVNQFLQSDGSSKLVYHVTTRAGLGLRNTLLTATRGTVIMNSLNIGLTLKMADFSVNRNGVLVVHETGTTTSYALQTAQERGTCFVGPGEKVYRGMIIGLNSRADDMYINVCKEKHLTNMRSKGSDGTIQLTPPTRLSLEQCLDFLSDGELLEITPKNLRLRKVKLN